MFEYKTYSTDIWDYLQDMPYMPSRQDRDNLIREGDYKRVNIWDYFFRINPDDVGQPQKKEIELIDKQMSLEIFKHNQTQQHTENQINNYKKALFQKRQRVLLYGAGILSLDIMIYLLFSSYEVPLNSSYICIFAPLTIIMLSGFFYIFIGRNEKRNINNLTIRSKDLSQNHDLSIKRWLKRKNSLRDEIKELKTQIPSYTSDETIRKWLREDFERLWKKSKEVTALSNRLIDIASDDVDEKGNPLKYPNPTAIFGPAELQDERRLPQTFDKNINPDLNKHLSARRSFYLSDKHWIEVVYGVYYLEHILIADDMLAMYGLFFDFITGKLHAEKITEQYYKDVVSIIMSNEFRSLHLEADENKVTYVEEAPTFTLSLASGENRTVTFVSKDYFMEIRQKIYIEENDISKIYWIGRSQKDANNAIKALRARLRHHKGDDNQKL